MTGDSGMPPFVDSVLNNGMYEVEQNLSSLMYEHKYSITERLGTSVVIIFDACSVRERYAPTCLCSHRVHNWRCSQ